MFSLVKLCLLPTYFILNFLLFLYSSWSEYWQIWKLFFFIFLYHWSKFDIIELILNLITIVNKSKNNFLSIQKCDWNLLIKYTWLKWLIIASEAFWKNKNVELSGLVNIFAYKSQPITTAYRTSYIKLSWILI